MFLFFILNKKLINIIKLINENDLYKAADSLIKLKREYGMIFPVGRTIRVFKHLIIEKGRFDQIIKVEELLGRKLNFSEKRRLEKIGKILDIMHS